MSLYIYTFATSMICLLMQKRPRQQKSSLSCGGQVFKLQCKSQTLSPLEMFLSHFGDLFSFFFSCSGDSTSLVFMSFHKSDDKILQIKSWMISKVCKKQSLKYRFLKCIVIGKLCNWNYIHKFVLMIVDESSWILLQYLVYWFTLFIPIFFICKILNKIG